MVRYHRHMARCTAPAHGHRTASGRAACPACGGGYRGYGGGYVSYSSPSYSSSGSSGGGRSSGGGSGSSGRPRWSPAGSSVAYTPAGVRALTPVRETVEKLVLLPERRDFFLCQVIRAKGGTTDAPFCACWQVWTFVFCEPTPKNPLRDEGSIFRYLQKARPEPLESSWVVRWRSS